MVYTALWRPPWSQAFQTLRSCMTVFLIRGPSLISLVRNSLSYRRKLNGSVSGDIQASTHVVQCSPTKPQCMVQPSWRPPRRALSRLLDCDSNKPLYRASGGRFTPRSHWQLGGVFRECVATMRAMTSKANTVVLAVLVGLLVGWGSEVTATTSQATLTPPPEPALTPTVEAAAATESAALRECLTVLGYLAVNHRHSASLGVESSTGPYDGWASGITGPANLTEYQNNPVVAGLLNVNCDEFLDTKLIESLTAGN